MSTLTYSFYCFNYKWDKWSFQKKIDFFNKNWIYFLGFGLPSILLCKYSNNEYMQVGIANIIFPVQVLLTFKTSNITPLPNALHINIFGNIISFLNMLFLMLETDYIQQSIYKSKMIFILLLYVSQLSLCILMVLNNI